MWVEINKRINYPLKEVLVEMEHKGEICMDDPLHRFCCSWLTLRVSNVGAKLFVASWNAHPIPGIIIAILPFLALVLMCLMIELLPLPNYCWPSIVMTW